MASKKKAISASVVEAPENLTDHPFYGMKLDDDQMVLANTIWDPDIDIVFVNARSGVGKTSITTGVANLLVQYGVFDNIQRFQ